MSGEAQALGKIVDGIKELGKALLPDEPKHEPVTTAAKPDPTKVTVNRELIFALMAAVKDEDIWRHVPMGMASPVTRLLDDAFPGWNS